MNNSFSYLCLHLVLLIFLDTVALKLIPGDRSVVKKDGATHTISRYYVVPKDFDANKANGSETVAATASNSRYAKSMDPVNVTLEVNATSEALIEEKNKDEVVNSKRANSDRTYTLEDIDIRFPPAQNDLVSLSHQLGLGQASANQALGNIEVAPISTPLFDNLVKNDSITYMNNGKFSDEPIETIVNNDEEENKFVSTDLRVLFDESSDLNADNFWRLFKIYVKQAKKSEQLVRIEKLFVLVNLFTDLYKATKVNIPIDDKINDIVLILQNRNKDPEIVNNRDEFQVDPLEQNLEENNYKLSAEPNQDDSKPLCQCKRKCRNRMFMDDDLDSKSVSVSETDGRTDLNQEPNLQRKESKAEDVNVWLKMPPSYSGKNSQPIKVQKRLLSNPLKILQTGKSVLGLPGYKVMSLSDRAQIGRENGIYEDDNLDLNIINTAEMNKQPFVLQEKSRIGLPLAADENINDGNINLPFIDGSYNSDSSYQSASIEARQTANPPLGIEDRQSFKQDPHPPIFLEDRQNFNQAIAIEDRQNINKDFVIEDRLNGIPDYIIEDRHKDFVIEDRQNADLPWVIEDRQNANLPWVIEDRQKANLPWVIEDRQKANLPWVIEDRQNTNLPWVIEDRQNANLPWVIEDRQKENLPWVIEDRQNKIKPFIFKKRIRGRPGLDIKSSLVKPHVYHTYIINPTKILYGEKPVVHNDLLKIISGKYKNNYQNGNGYDISATHGKPQVSKYTLIKKPSGGYYESEISLSNGKQRPGILPYKPGYRESVVNIQREINVPNYDNGVDGSQTYLRPGGSPNGYESNTEVKYEEESDINPLIYSNQPSYEANVNLEYNRPAIEEVSANSEVFYNNRPSHTHDTKVHIDLEQHTPHYTDTDIAGNYEATPPTQPFNTYEKELQLEIGGQTDYQPLPIVHSTPSIHKSSYLKLQNTPVPGFNGHTDVNSEVYINQPQQFDLQYNKNPNHISYYEHTQQAPAYSHIDRLRAQLAPSYKLFSIENLLKLQDALNERRQFNKLSVYEERALVNLNKINNILLVLAEQSGSDDISKIWYENIFFNGGNIQKDPLQLYVYNLIRQKWLHEIMLLLQNNNFNLNILNNPKLFSFLGTLQFPNSVLKYIETSNVVVNQHQHERPYIFEENYGAHNVNEEEARSVIDEDVFEPHDIINSEILDNYVTENEGLILSITGLDIGLDANAIIDILKKYLVYQNYVEKQENVVSRGNKIEMFKQIVVFLREKGYNNDTILDLIHKLYRAVYRVEEKGCNRNQVNDFVQTAYDVILPVLRRSGH